MICMFFLFHFISFLLISHLFLLLLLLFFYIIRIRFSSIFFRIATNALCLLNDKHLFLNVNDSFISFNGERSLMIMTMILNKTRIFHFLWFDSCFFLFGSIEEKINRFNIDFSFSLSIQISIFFKFKGVIHTFHSDLIHTHIPYLRKQIFWKIEMKKTFIARTLKNQTIAPYLNFADFNLDDIVVVVVYGQTYTTAIAQNSSWVRGRCLWWLRKKKISIRTPPTKKKPPLLSSSTTIFAIYNVQWVWPKIERWI